MEKSQKPAIVLIEGVPGEALRRVCMGAKTLGYQIIHLTDEPSRAKVLANFFDLQIVCQTDSVVAMKEKIDVIDFDIVAIGSTDGFNIGVANELAIQYDLPHIAPDVMSVCCDKAFFRQFIEDNWPCINPKWVYEPKPAIGVDFNRISDLFEKSKSKRLVIKPTKMCGGIGISLVDHIEDARQAVDQMSKKFPEEKILIESFIDGTELSVEVFDGEILGITQVFTKYENGFSEIGQHFPSEINESLSEKIEEITSNICQQLGLVRGPAHFQYLVDGNEIYIIEINPRIPGGLVAGLVYHSTGVDFGLLYCEFILGSPKKAEIKCQPIREAAGFFLMAERDINDRLIELKGMDECRQIAGVECAEPMRSEGDCVIATGSNADRLAYIITAGNDRNNTRFEAASLVSKIVPLWKNK